MNGILKKVSLVLAASCLLAVSRGDAGITINADIDNLGGGAAAGDTAIIIADLDGSGLTLSDLDFSSDPAASANNWSLDADDLVLGVYSFGAANHLTIAVNYEPTVLGVDVGDDLYVVWYPGLVYNGSLTGAGQGQTFGIYRDSDGDNGYGAPFIGWDSPTDGGTYDLFRANGEGSYNNPSASFQTAVIPEPSSAMLVLCGLGLMRLFTRRKR